MAVGKIQRTPSGLLQFLGMVGTGVPPTLMADDVRATFNVLPFYGVSLMTGQSANGTLTNAGDNVELLVPAGQQWVLLAAQGTVTLGAANETARLALQIVARNNQRIRVATGPELFAGLGTAIGDIVSVATTFPQPLVLASGMGLRCSLEMDGLAAARNANVAALIYQFEA